MKINFSKELFGIGNHRHRGQLNKDGSYHREQFESISARAQNYNKPAGQNPCGFITFKGNIVGSVNKLAKSALSNDEITKAAQKGGKTFIGKVFTDWTNNLVKSEKFNNATKYVLEHEAMFNALVSLGIVTVIRPAITLSMPVSDKKDKIAVASKEIIGGIVGYGLATAILKPINVAVTKISKNYSKYIKNDNQLLEKLGNDKYLDSFISFWKNIPETAIAPIKGAIIVALMPGVINIIDKVRAKKPYVPSKQEIDEISVVNSHCNSAQKQNDFTKITSEFSFKGGFVPKNPDGFFYKIGDRITDEMAKGIGWLAKTKPAKATADGITEHFNNPTQRIQDLTSIVYTLTLLQKTAKSKKIKKEQKPMLMLNAVLVTAVSSTLAALVDAKTKPMVERMSKAYQEFDKPANWLSNEDFLKGLKKMKSYTVFTSIVRFVVPVMMVPITGAIIKKIKSSKKADNDINNKNKAEAKAS